MADLVEVNGFQYKRATAEKLGLVERRGSAHAAVSGPSSDKAVKAAPQTGSPVPQSSNPDPSLIAPPASGDAGAQVSNPTETVVPGDGSAQVPPPPGGTDVPAETSTPAAATTESTAKPASKTATKGK